MRYLPDGKMMSEADAFTIHKIGIPSLVLMERAALKIVETMNEKKISTEKSLIVCGSGNNGGDGFAVARLLTELGKHADVLFAGKETSLSEECRCQKQIVENMGISVFTEYPEKEYTVIIDAIFGVGLSREITGHYRDVINWMNLQDTEKVAVDIPSGISASTGQVLGTAFRADLTVCMACEKLGCEFFPGKEYAGMSVPVSIGIDPIYFTDQKEVCYTYDKTDLGKLLPERKKNSHKGSYGKVLMITGSPGMAGAAFLSAAAAYTVGTGLVQIYTAAENRQVLQELLPEAIISCYTTYEEEQLHQLLEWADVVCIGCGLGTGETSRKLLQKTLKTVVHPCVIDADGLNLLSENPELLKERKAPVILTPHIKEMSRLSGISVSGIIETRMKVIDQILEQAEQDSEFQSEQKIKSPSLTCVLKDSRTVVAQKDRQKFVNLAGNNSMAKGGSGDVLAGVITGLLAQHMDPFEAAAVGVFLHACGGDEAAKEKGNYSVLARDLINGVACAMKKAKEC